MSFPVETASMVFEHTTASQKRQTNDIKSGAIIETVRSVEGEADSEHGQSHRTHPPHWNPGFVSRFPWLGFFALCMVLACMAAAVTVLLVSDGMSQNSKLGHNWPKKIAPSVILSGLNSISSLCFSMLIANGIAVAWWRKTLKGATIQELHESWSFATSMKEVLLAGRGFNVIALAALTTKLTLIDGMLMQSATKTGYTDDPPNMNVSNTIQFPIHQELPITGWVNPGANDFGLLTETMRNNLAVWQRNTADAPMYTTTGCDDVCFVTVTGAGLEFDCNEPVSKAVDFSRDLVNTTYVRPGTAFDGLVDATNLTNTMYKISFAGVYSNGSDGLSSHIHMDIVHTMTEDNGESSCAGVQLEQSCKLWPAVIDYPLMITSGGDADADGDGKSDDTSEGDYEKHIQTVRVGAVEGYWESIDAAGPSDKPYQPFDRASGQQAGFKVHRRTPVLEGHGDTTSNGANITSSRLAGLVTSLNTFFGANANITKRFGYVVAESGSASLALTQSLVLQAEVGIEKTIPVWSQCNYSYVDPFEVEYFPNLAGNINSMMFAVAVDYYGFEQQMDALPQAVSDDLSQDPGHIWMAQFPYNNANIYSKSTRYHTNKRFMFGAIVSTLACIVCVLPVYWGYWQLGRDVSLGPFEIAHAFQSPLTSQASNGSIRQLITEVGQREVRYGQYTAADGRTVFVVADPDQLAQFDRDTKTEFREQVRSVLSRGKR